MEHLIRQLITAIGEDPTREGLVETPRRVAAAWGKFTEGYSLDPREIITTFASEQYDEMVVVKDVEFYSMCEHHLLPFFGRVSVGYIPRDRIVGLSKIPRLVDIFARRLQNQERMTKQIADTLQELLNPKGVGVIVTANHLCTRMRGVEKENVTMTTSSLTGLFKTDPKTRDEFLNLTKK